MSLAAPVTAAPQSCIGTGHGGANQRFGGEDAGDRFYRIRAKHSGKVLDVTGGSRENGARVIQWDQTGGANQLWRHGVPID